MASRTITSLLLLLVLGASDARASCAVSASVTTTIQSAVNAIPSPLTGDYCITVPQSAYGEQVVITGKDTAGFRIYLTSQPGSAPIIDPPGGSQAAFVVDNASVTLIGLRLSATNSPTWSVLGSSGVIELRSISAEAPVSVSTQALLFDVTGPALILDGEASQVLLSSAASVTINGRAPSVNGLRASTLTVQGDGLAVFNTTAPYISVAGLTPTVRGVVVSTLSVTGTFANVVGVSASSVAVDGINASVASVTASNLFASGFSADLRNLDVTTATVSGDGVEVTSVRASLLSLTGGSAVLYDVSGASVTLAGTGNRLSSATLAGLLDVSGSAAVVQDSFLSRVVVGPNADQALVVRSTAAQVFLDRSQQPTLAYSWVYGSTAVVVSGSTGAVVHSNVLTGAGASGNVVSGGANVGLTIASNTIVGGLSGVYVDRGNQGLVMISSNVIRGGIHGVLATVQAAGSQVHVTSNSINPALLFGVNTYGLRFDGLTTPTSIYHNDVFHSGSVSMGGATSLLLWARNSSGLVIHNNRFFSPGAASVGNLTGLFLENTPNAVIWRNDGYLATPSISNSYMLQLSAGSSGATLRENIFVMDAVGTSTATVNVDASSVGGLSSDYNAFFSSAGAPVVLAQGARRRFPAAWRVSHGQDYNSIAADPDWASATDLHPRSQGGRWDPALPGFVNDAVTSPTIGRGPGGGNLGSYAGTSEASLPFTDLPAGCPSGFNVKLDGSRDVADLQLAVDSLPRSAVVDACVVVRDTQTYAGTLTFEHFAQAADVRYKLLADPSFVSSAPAVSGLVVRTSSVTVDRLFVRPVANVAVPVIASSASVVLTTVTVDGGSFVTQAGVRVSSMGVVRFSSVTVFNAVGLEVDGLGVEVSSTWLQTSIPFSALRLGGGSLSSNGPLTVIGVLDVADGVWAAGPHDHQLHGDLTMGPAASLSHQGSTLTFTGASHAHQRITLAPTSGGVFGHVVIHAATATFNRGFDALSLLFDAPGGTITFAGAQTYTLGQFVVQGSTLPRSVIRSSTGGSAWLLNVGRSSVTASWVRDSLALSLVHANDGTSLQGPNVVNWNFKPFLATLLPGESWVQGAGKAGSPTPVAAGDAFDVAVQAYDSSSNTLSYPAFAAALSWSELFVATPTAQPLAGGATVFSNVSFRTAQTAVLSPRTTDAFEVWGSTLAVGVGAAARMQVLLTGEEPVPGSPAGKTGAPEVGAVGQPLSVTLRQTDLFWNLVNSADQVELSTASPLASNLPQTAVLQSGATVFSNVVFLASGVVQLTGRDLSAPFTLTDTGSVLEIFSSNSSSPLVTVAIPAGSLRATLGGEVSGTASDIVAVSRVSVAVQRRSDDLWYDWPSAAFSAAAPVFGLAGLTPSLAKDTNWAITLPDAELSDGTSYYVVARATNPSANLSIVETTFTYTLAGLTPGSGGDGAGSLTALPASGVGCDVGVSTLVYTAGAPGLGAGGLVSIRLPDGWTRPSTTTAADPPVNPGEVRVFPLDAAVSLQDGWIHVSTPLAAGQSLEVKVRAFRASRSYAQAVLALSRGAAGGQTLPLSALPTVFLTAGSTQAVRFSPASPLALGPLQTSSTMQLVLTDLCGTETVAASTVTFQLGADPQTVFYSTGGVLMTLKQVPIAQSSSRSRFGFYVVPSTSATGITASASGFAAARRDVRVLASTLVITGVSIDTGTLNPGVLVATMTVNPLLRPAFVNFTLPGTGVPWEVLITTAPDGTEPLARRSGSGEPGREVTWSALDERASPYRSVAPGDYWARIEAGGGVAISSSARLRVQASAVPSIYGSVGAAGASARVAASGPGAGPGSFAVASSSGFFQVFGLRAGTTYELRVASASVVWSTSAAAAFGGVDVGTLTVPTTGRLRLSVGLPLTAPAELWARALLRDASFSRTARLALRFSSGSSVSDDGAPGFGATGSTWAVADLPPGQYSLELDLPEVGLSTRVPSLTLTAGGVLDLRLSLPRKPRAAGRLLLPEAPAVPVTVALAAGSLRSSVLVQGSSAAFSLFGLDAGTVTLTASAEGYRPASASLTVTTSDVTGLDLSLSTHGVITGTVAVAGAPAQELVIDAYHPATGARARSSVLLPVSTFTFTGLADGVWELSASLDGYVGGRSSAAAGGSVVLSLTPEDAWTLLTVRLPGNPAPADFRRAALAVRGDDGLTLLRHDLIGGATAQYFVSSATVRLGGLPPGRVSFTALYQGTGATSRFSRLLTQGATDAVTVDLTASTYTVRGSVAVNGAVVYSSAGYSVTVSSVPGLLANAATSYLCLLGSTSPVRAAGFHVQLVPVEPGLSTRELRRSGSCAGAALSDDETPVAYLAAVNVDGTFELRGVPAGAYVLRSFGDLDGDPATGDELPSVSTAVWVTGDLSGLTLRLDRGRRLSGRVTGAPGRPFVVSLVDASGALTRSVAAAPDWTMDGVAPGDYTVYVQEAGSPKLYAARPLRLTVLGDLSGLQLPVERAGSIAGRLALEAPASGAVVVTASAEPWFHGGAYLASVSGDRFTVEGLPPGDYELRAQPADGRFVRGSLPGVTVAAGRVTEAGTLVVPLARELRGRVMGGGAPLAGVPIDAIAFYRSRDGAPLIRTVTGVDGRYVLTGLDPRARVYDITAATRLEHDAFGAAARWKPQTRRGVDVTSAAAVDFELSPALWSIRGRVSPAPATLSLTRVGGERGISAFTRNDGSFELPSLATATYRLTARSGSRASWTRLVTITGADVDVGTITLTAGATLSGRLLKTDGSNPSYEEVTWLYAATADLSEQLSAALGAGNGEYELSGFRPGRTYRLLAVGRSGQVSALEDVSFSTTTESRRLDLVYRAPRPSVVAKARRNGSSFDLVFDVTSPLRARAASDDDLSVILATFSAAGTLSRRALQDGRTRLTAVYTPAVGESSFTLRFAAYASALDPESADPANREHLVVSTVAFFTGVEGAHRSDIPNLTGGAVGIEGDAGRVVLLPGAFGVDASSSVQVTLNVARSAAAALPAGLTRAMAAAPPDVPAFSAFYDVLLPPGVRTTLNKPTPLQVAYSTGADPSRLNLYWYNPASNSYVLQQDVTGASPLIDAVNRTITVNVDHFSTFVLFEAGVNVIGGSAFGGGELDAYNFPNPFDLREKVVTTIHGGGTPSVRGTMIRFSLPAGTDGAASIRIYNVAGERVRTLELGQVSGGSYYYQPWDGRTDSGADAASGVYIGVLKVGKKTKSFKMALIK